MSIQTFIFVHNQDIILDFIKHKKFDNFNNLMYIFLGNGDVTKITNLSNVIIARDCKYNIEEYPKLTSYTGWYCVWKNNLVNSEYINLFEYDINVSEELEKNIIETYNNNQIDILGYIPINVHSPSFLKSPQWSDKLIESLHKEYSVNILDFVNNMDINKICSVTSNHTFNKKTFEDYMNWTEKIIDYIKVSPLAGHQIERSISVYYLLNNKNYTILNDVLHHFQFDSHKTQNISQDKFKNNYNQLLS
jgi:hypothetical protein